MSIFLMVLKTIPCIIIPIIRFSIVLYLCFLVWWPLGFGSTLKSSMSIILTVVEITFKSLCMHGLGSTFMCLMTFLVALMTMNHALWINILICNLALAQVSSMSFLTTIMTSRFGVLTFDVPFFYNFGWFSFFNACVAQSWCIIVGSKMISIISQSIWWLHLVYWNFQQIPFLSLDHSTIAHSTISM